MLENQHCIIIAPPPAPPTPTGVAVSEVTSSTVQMRWTAPPTEAIPLLGYSVSFERVPGSGCDSPHSSTYTVSNTTTNYTFVGLSGFSTYTVSVAAVNTFDSSDKESISIATLSSCEYSKL